MVYKSTVCASTSALTSANPPIDTPSRCANARRPENGHVKCCIDLSSFDDVETNSGGKSGGKSSGGSSKGRGVYTCTYTCNPGFKLNGPSVLECPIDKVTDNPTCEPGETVLACFLFILITFFKDFELQILHFIDLLSETLFDFVHKYPISSLDPVKWPKILLSGK